LIGKQDNTDGRNLFAMSMPVLQILTSFSWTQYCQGNCCMSGKWVPPAACTCADPSHHCAASRTRSLPWLVCVCALTERVKGHPRCLIATHGPLASPLDIDTRAPLRQMNLKLSRVKMRRLHW